MTFGDDNEMGEFIKQLFLRMHGHKDGYWDNPMCGMWWHVKLCGTEFRLSRNNHYWMIRFEDCLIVLSHEDNHARIRSATNNEKYVEQVLMMLKMELG